MDDPVNQSCLDLDLVKQYVAYGGDVNQRTGGGVSLLFLAAVHFQGKAIAEFLVSCGAQMSAFEQVVVDMFRDEHKRRVKATVMKLVDQDPRLIRQTDYEGFTLLHHAVRHYQFQLVPFLLDRGADVNALSHRGKTPLALFGMKPTSRAGVIYRKLLIEHGAEYSAREKLVKLIYEGDDDGAIERFETFPALKNGWIDYGSGGPFLHMAAWLGKSDRIVEYLLRHGVDPNVPNKEGKTALFQIPHRVVDKRPASLAIIRTLIQHGADVNHRDNNFSTPLHSAASDTWEEPLKLLIELGADINAETKDGWTPLDVVYHMRFLGCRSLAHWMKTKGARTGKKKGRVVDRS